MGYNQKMFGLGSKRSIIREIFEYSKTRSAEIGAEHVFDFSLGNPSVPAPAEVNDTIRELLDTQSSVLLHGYTSAQGDLTVRRVIANRINAKFGVCLTPDLLYMTCGAAASLSICLKALIEEVGEEVVVFAPFFTEYRVFITKNSEYLRRQRRNINIAACKSRCNHINTIFAKLFFYIVRSEVRINNI